MVTVQCVRCGKRVKRYPSQAAGNNYCSLSCATSANNHAKNISRRGKPQPWKLNGTRKPCPGCGQSVYVRPSDERNGWKRYCSQSCYRADPDKRTRKGQRSSPETRARIAAAATRPKPWLRKNRTRECKHCGSEFQHRSGDNGANLFCTAECWYGFVRANPSAAGSYIDGLGRTLRGQKLWKARRKEALARDGHVCQRCGNTPPVLLHVHHIRPCREFGDHQIEQAHALDNLVTVCSHCHPAVEAGH